MMSLPGMTALGVFFTYFGDSLAFVIILGFVYWSYDKKFAKYIALNSLTSLVINTMIKNIFIRVRPYMANESIKCLKPVDSKSDIYDIKAQGYSFPSGHATNVTSLFSSISIYLKNSKIRLASLVIILLTCLSRFALGVHYPSDVLMGALLGIVTVMIFDYVQTKIEYRKLALICLVFFTVGFLYCKSNDFYSCYGIFAGFIAADIFEEKYVDFKNTRNILKAVLRVLIGALIFMAVSEVLKLPLSKSFLESDSILSSLFRVFRYCLATFVSMGVYPILFKYNVLKLKDGE